MAESRNLLSRNPLRGRFVRDGDPATDPASILCLPNVISLVRILFIPVMVWLILADATIGICTLSMPPTCISAFPVPQEGVLRWIAAAIFIVAIATDALDGHLARSRRLITYLGIFLDPVADKGLTGAALICLAIVEPYPWFWWPVVILILIREWGITWWRAAALADRVIPAGKLGKIKTVVQAVTIGIALLPLAPFIGPAWHIVTAVLVGIAFVLTIWSGIDYLVTAYRPGPAARAQRDEPA